MVTTPEGDAGVRPGQDRTDARQSPFHQCPSCGYLIASHRYTRINYEHTEEGTALRIACVLHKGQEAQN